MKKLLTIATVGVFILTLAAVTYAVDLKTSGFVRNRTGWYRNADSDIGPATAFAGLDDSQSWVDYRARIKFDAIASEDLKGTLYFEMDDKWGGTADGALGADATNVEIKNAFLSFKVPGTDNFPTTLTAGIQGFFLAAPFGLDDDASGITIDSKIEPAEIRLIWLKQAENNTWQSDDINDYGFKVTVPFGDLRPAVWFLYSNIGGGTTATRLGGAASNSSSDLYWLGFGLDGKIGPVSLEADFAYNGGDLDYSVPVGTVDKDEFGGYAFFGKASMPVSQFEVGAEFMYATGDDLNNQSATKSEFDGYVLPPGGAAYHPTVVFWSSSVNDSVGITGNAAGGDYVIKGFASMKPLDWLKVTGYVAYIGDTVDNGDKFGTATTTTGLEDNSDIGLEFGGIANISIYKGLTYKVAAGWLSAGDALDQATATPGANQSPDDPWAVVSQLIYKF